MKCCYLRYCGFAVFAAAVTLSLTLVAARAADSTSRAARLVSVMDDDRAAPVDYGYGPGVARSQTAKAMTAAVSAYGATPQGGPTAGLSGMFGTPIPWPIIAIHMILLPDGRIMSYGTDELGNQGAGLLYSVWNPTLGTDATSQLMLANTTPTDLFCSGQSVMWTTGDVLITGGSVDTTKTRNLSNKEVNVFSPQANTLTDIAPMQYARWYGSLVALPSGDMVVFGGRASKKPQPVPTPEVYNSATGWQTLTGATSDLAYGIGTGYAWYYPRAYVAPGGSVFVLGHDGNMFSVSTSGAGSIAQLPVTTLVSQHFFPTISFAPGKLLSLRNDAAAVVVDFTQPTPVVTQTANLDQIRYWADATVLADGRVMISGGSLVENKLKGADYEVQIWDSTTGLWSPGASAAIPRLYHSTALLLPDASVLTAGGGSPGPIKELNAEIYYPPYLYVNDGSGQPAIRPSLSGAPTSIQVGQPLSVTVGPTDQIARMTLVRTGSSSHANNSDQRFIDLTGFVQTDQLLSATLPSDPTVLLPGYYMLFVFNQAGVPSIANIMLITT